MHRWDIIYRDIKPQNVFVVRQRPTWHVKIGDFGFSKRVSDSVSAPFSARGTPKYMAPEYRDLMSNYKSSDFTTSVDMWSLGCLTYELFTKRCPFDEDNSNPLMKPDYRPTREPAEANFSATTSASSREAPAKSTVSAPLPPVIVSDETQEASASADDAPLTIGETFHVPELPHRLRSSNATRSDMLQDVKDMQLAVRPDSPDIYYCKDCGLRPLCERCIRGSFNYPTDPHGADHKVQVWIQAHSFPLAEFVDRFEPFPVESKDGLDPFYGNKWLSSDYSYNPPAEGAHGTRDFDMSVQVRIICVDEAIDSAAIRKHKNMMVQTKAVPLGSILFGVRVIDPQDEAKQSDELNSSSHLPEQPVEKWIKIAREEQTVTLSLGFKLKATTSQKIEVHLRGSYDVLSFKAGSLYNWLKQMGTEQFLASLGDLKVRERAKQKQVEAKRNKRIMRGVQYLGHGLGIAGKINGVRAASPSKQSNAMVSAVSAGLSFGGSMMKDRTSHNHAAAPTPTLAEIDDNPHDSQEQQQQYLEDNQDSSERDSEGDWDQQQQ
ncbi:MAG: hypothetical protein Q9188_005632 [Gyalolechia gomerana]